MLGNEESIGRIGGKVKTVGRLILPGLDLAVETRFAGPATGRVLDAGIGAEPEPQVLVRGVEVAGGEHHLGPRGGEGNTVPLDALGRVHPRGFFAGMSDVPAQVSAGGACKGGPREIA